MTSQGPKPITISDDVPIRKKMLIMPNPKEEPEEYSFLYISEL